MGAVFLFIPRRWIEKPANFADYFLPLRALKDRAVPKLAAPLLNRVASKGDVDAVVKFTLAAISYRCGCAALKYEKEHY